MGSVWILEQEECCCGCPCIIGVYSSEELAQEAKSRMLETHTASFEITEHSIDAE